MNDDLDRELQTHLDLEAEEQREAGLPADQARYAALKTLGNQTHIREDVRALSAHRFYEDLGYTNIKTQYSFIKPLDPAASARVRMFVPRVDVGN